MKFQPQIDSYTPWSNLGVEDLDKLIFAFMMPSLLKYPQILEATSILKDSPTRIQQQNFNEFKKAINFKMRGFGIHNPSPRIPDPVFMKQKPLED